MSSDLVPHPCKTTVLAADHPSLSRELDPSKIEASLRDGVLRLHIPKAEEARPRRIEVKVG